MDSPRVDKRRRAHVRPPARGELGKAAENAVGQEHHHATSSTPIQKYQYCGSMPENWSRATMKIAAPISPP